MEGAYRGQARHKASFPRHEMPGLYQACRPELWRAQGMPGASRTRSLVCEMKKHTSKVTTGRAEQSGIPCAMVLPLIPRSPRSAGLVSLRRSSISAFRPKGRNRISMGLAPASGCQDHAAWRSASAPLVCNASASTASRFTSGDDWPSRPSCRGGMALSNHKFRFSEREIFLQRGLDRNSGVLPVVSRRQHSASPELGYTHQTGRSPFTVTRVPARVCGQ